MNRSDSRNLWLHQAVARALERNPVCTISLARQNLARLWTQHPRSRFYLEKWSDILCWPKHKIVEVLTSIDEDSRDLRSCSPFAGTLTESQRRSELEEFWKSWEETLADDS
jgi:hypothetical protein